MGNVHASSKSGTETLSRTPPLGLNLPPLQTDLTKNNTNLSKDIENPGSIEELHKKCKGMF